MNTNNFQKVFSVNGQLQAAVVQKALELAGVPVNLQVSRQGAYLDILVPQEKAFDAKNLLVAKDCLV